ncbi:DUF2325 domain-containing protein [Staphylococcus chromogenes]|uniref:DUF2325 domain-containing protein n=1 Tax=Staphylococcus chromogenes TaxID=46126 RepID=UPI00188E439A|nr:DUF2325 domain-containing protein [Staphylococcus chromogenes]
MNNYELITAIKENWINSIRYLKDTEKIEVLSKSYLVTLKELENIESLLLSEEELDDEVAILKEATSKESSSQLKKENNYSSKSPKAKSNLYIFQRRLRGGVAIQKNNTNVIVDTEVIPEGICRELSLNNGDVLSIQKNYYDYKKHLFKKECDVDPDFSIDEYPLISYSHAITSYDDTLKEYVVNSYYSEEGLKNIPPIIISSEDADRYHLKEGDLIDIAHLPDRNSAKVRWLYRTDYPVYKTPFKSSHYKDDVPKESSETQEEKYKSSPIQGKTIFVIGAYKYINGYKDEIEKRGGHLLHSETDKESVSKNYIKQSDVCVIPISNTSHGKMYIAKAHCKESNVPYLILKSTGRANFIREIEHLLQHMKQGE